MTEVNSSNILTITVILIQEWLVKDKDSHPYSLKQQKKAVLCRPI